MTTVLATSEFRPVSLDDLRQQLNEAAGAAREGRLDPALAMEGGGAPPQPQDAAPAPVASGSAVQPATAPRRAAAGGVATLDPEDPTTWGKVPRNAPCPCGSGKKYKHCHGAV